MKSKKMFENNNIRHDSQNKTVSHHQARIEMWKRLLNSRKAKNVLLKSSLADILRNNFDQNSLEEIEDFQTRFVTEDELIDLLRKEVEELDSLPHRDELGKNNSEESRDGKMTRLSKDIAISTTRFNKLNAAFDEFQHQLNDKAKMKI